MKLAIEKFKLVSLERMSFSDLYILCSFLNQRSYMPKYALQEHITELRIGSILMERENIELRDDDLENECLSRGILSDDSDRKQLLIKL